MSNGVNVMKNIILIPMFVLFAADSSYCQTQSLEMKKPGEVLGINLDSYRSAKSELRTIVDSWFESKDQNKRLAACSLLIDHFQVDWKLEKASKEEDNELLHAAHIACQIHINNYQHDEPELVELVHQLPVWDSTTIMSIWTDSGPLFDTIMYASLRVASLPTASTEDLRRVLIWEGLDGAPAEDLFDAYNDLFKNNPKQFLSAASTLKPGTQVHLGDFMDPIPYEDVELLESVTRTMQANDDVCAPDSLFETTLKERLKLK